MNTFISLLHVGSGPFPDYPRPEGAAWIWEERTRTGPVASEILAAADALDADLIVMPTDGRSGFVDALRESFTERVVDEARCPVLAVPAAS